MKRFSEQFHKKAQTVKLKKAEQADVRARLVSYMEYHPLPAQMKAATTRTKKTAARPLSTEPFTAVRIPFMQLFKVGGVLASVVLVVIPFVAEQAVPGDTLYAVKVNFNEEVRGTLTLDPYERVEWETVRLNRRIAEAKLLQKEGRLTAEVEAATAAAVTQHANNAKAEIETLRASDADTAAIATIELDSTLSLQAQALGTTTASSTAVGTDLIASAIDASLSDGTTVSTSSLPALSKLVARVEQHTTRVRELQQTLSSQVDTAALADVTRRIEDLERVAARAFALPQESAGDAQLMLVDVVGRAQKLIVFMSDLQVRQDIAIETAVPVVPTDDEIHVERAQRLTQIDQYLDDISRAEVDDQELVDKLDAIAGQIQEAKEEAEAFTNHDAFMDASAAAVALGQDALILIEQAGVTIAVPTTTTANTTDQVATSTATTTDEVVPEPDEEVVEPVEEPVVEPEPVATTDETTDLSDETTATTTPTQEPVDEPADVSSSTAQSQETLDA